MAAAQAIGLDEPRVRARQTGRDKLRDQLGDILDEEPGFIEVHDVPMLPTADQRAYWIAERLSAGLWRTSDKAVLAAAWGVSEVTVRNYAATAARFKRLATGELQQELVDLAATRIARIAAIDDPVLALRACELQLKLTGHLKGGAEHHAPSNAELEAQMIAALRDPDDMMTRWLRAAMSDPGEGLRALMAEFSVPVTAGVELT